MKITFTTLLILSGLFFTNVEANAQTPAQRAKITESYDLRKIEQMKNELQREYNENHAKALELAKINNWPLQMNKPNGGFAQLVGVSPQNTPLYYTTDNNGVAISSRANSLQPGGSLGLNLAGQDMVAGVWDGGKIRASHLDYGTRTYSFDQSGMQAAFHPTHVAGTIISSGANSNNNAGRGVAYMASAWYSDWSNDLVEMASAAASGVLLSNHSYGLDPAAPNFSTYLYGSYINQSKGIDDVMYNAPMYQAVVSAGNSRSDGNQIFNPGKSGYDLITSFATSKNAIVVAAVNNVPNYTGPASVVMSAFSSYGPTDDRRIKPDISTKGVNVSSTSNTSNTAYASSSGTSMSSPGVTGTLLLVQQHYGMLNADEYMKAATLKSLMTHTADEAGQYDGPDVRFGWGLINAEKMAQTITKAQLSDAIISELNLAQGATYTKTVKALGTEKLIATIGWTDKGGTPNNSVIDLSTPVLVNDLDIRITKDDVVAFPWKLDELPTDPAIKGDNALDNIEKVEINEPTSIGNYTITVTHKGNLFSGSQDFSLIVTGIQNELGVDDQIASTSFKIWPNPANNILNLSFANTVQQEDAVISVYDIQGRTMMQRKVSQSDLSSNVTLDVSSLVSGMYIVNVNQGLNQTSTKFVKQ